MRPLSVTFCQIGPALPYPSIALYLALSRLSAELSVSRALPTTTVSVVEARRPADVPGGGEAASLRTRADQRSSQRPYAFCPPALPPELWHSAPSDELHRSNSLVDTGRHSSQREDLANVPLARALHHRCCSRRPECSVHPGPRAVSSRARCCCPARCSRQSLPES